MQNGIVKSWDKAKGFGFISNKDDEDFFVHSSDLDITVKEKILRPGQKVAFDIRSDYRGDRAVHVRILNPK
jgi:cold shock protein